MSRTDQPRADRRERTAHRTDDARESVRPDGRSADDAPDRAPSPPPSPGPAPRTAPEPGPGPAPTPGTEDDDTVPLPVVTPATRAPVADPPGPDTAVTDPYAAGTPVAAFDALYRRHAPCLVRQAYLLTGDPRTARRSVEYAFQLAWQRWPEVAVDRDPGGWIRAAAYEYALSPWRRSRPTRTDRRPGSGPAAGATAPADEPADAPEPPAPARPAVTTAEEERAAAPGRIGAPGDTGERPHQTSARPRRRDGDDARPDPSDGDGTRGENPTPPPAGTGHADPGRPAVRPRPGAAHPALLDALLCLPRPYRRALLLYDGLGLGLPETAAETEATTPATVNRLRNAHARLAERLPELRVADPTERHRILRRRLTEAAAAQPLETRSPQVVRVEGERAVRRWTRAAIGLPVSFAVAIGLAVAISLDRGVPASEPAHPPAATPSSVHSGPR